MDDSAHQRPALTRGLSGAELQRWYWLKEELADFARTLGIRPSGSKETLTRRVVAALDGVTFDEPTPTRRRMNDQLSGPLTADTVIPAGQRCSQVIRGWFVHQVGDSFHFDGEMRAYFAGTDGTQTLEHALDHYQATRSEGPKAIDPQFEYNRFTRAWNDANPGGSRGDLLSAWREYRRLPVDARARV